MNRCSNNLGDNHMPVRATPTVSRLCVALLAALALPALAQESTQTETSTVSKTLDKVMVTGSRLKRTDVEEALPITIVQKAEIDA